MPKTILENKNFLIINKPAGLVVHSDGKTKEPNLCDWLLENYPDTKGVGEPFKLNDGTLIDRPGIVHRLDRETSGVMIVARNQKTFDYLKNLFQNRQIEKTYHAFVYGNIKEDSGTISAPIGRNKNNFKQWQAG
jgi:23S rRNA pseudouridine1911/1915/1917 synthase